MAGEQLERSILERKERDELHAIAAAMSLAPRPRSKKADIIDLILRATGVDPDQEAAQATNGNGNRNGAGHENGNGTHGAADAPEAPAGPRRRTSTRRSRTTTTAEAVAEAAAELSGDGEPTPEREERSAAPTSEAAITERAPAPSAEATEGNGRGRRAGYRTRGEDAPARNGSQAASDERAAVEGEAVQLPLGDGAATNETSRRDLAQPGRDRSGPVHAGQAELGNRRGRRRRGRERDRGEPVSGQDQPWQGELVSVKGLLDLREEGYGFVRTTGYLPSQKDVYVSVNQARRFALRRGDVIEGACRPAGASEKYPALVRIDSVGGMSPDEARQRPRFEDLTPLFPDEPLHLELPGDPANLTARIVDLISPVGKGQRGMIVSPPKAGKTTVMKQIAHSIEANNPDVHLIVLLVDERPEEVTDMRRSVKGEVIASTFDRPADEHTTVAELTIERAKRLVELGRDVVIILDGITRLARAYNLAQPATGRIMSGGVDSGALYPPKRFFGAARNIEEGGSLTILATALVETGSKMDEVIFEEFKGTGNMELRLDRRLAERRLYPAIDVNASSTRHEELLFDRSQLQQVWKLRRVLNALANEGNAAAGLELLIDKIRSTRSNDEFLAEIAKAPVPTA